MPAHDADVPLVPADRCRMALEVFHRAREVVRSGNFEFGTHLLLSCCNLDPANLVYRRALRATGRRLAQQQAGAPTKSALVQKVRLRAAKLRGNPAELLDACEAVLLLDPTDAATHLILAEAAEALDLTDLAVWSLEQACRYGHVSATVGRNLARLYEARGDYDRARKVWEWLRRAPSVDAEAQEQVRDLAANETIARGRFEEKLASKSDRPKAETLPEVALTKEQPACPARSASPHETEEARLLGCIQADPSAPAAYLHLAAFYRRAGRLDQAAQVLRQGLGPSGFAAELALALTDLDLEPLRRELAAQEERQRLAPQDAEAARQYARLRKHVNRQELLYYRQKTQLAPVDPQDRYEYGVRLLRAGRFKEAIPPFQRLRSDRRLCGPALFQLGRCFQGLGNWTLAQRNFEAALRELPRGEQDLRKEILFELASGAAANNDDGTALERGYELANLEYHYRGIHRLIEEWQKRKDARQARPAGSGES